MQQVVDVKKNSSTLWSLPTSCVLAVKRHLSSGGGSERGSGGVSDVPAVTGFAVVHFKTISAAVAADALRG